MPRFSTKVLVILFFVLFVVSTTILLIASTADVPALAWGGYLDVGVVVIIAALGIAIYQRSKEDPRYGTSYHRAMYLLILVGMWKQEQQP